MATVHVNGKPVDIGNDRLNCVQAAERAGVHVPHYCYHEALSVVASCRMCLVEVGEMKDGKAVMVPRVVPACQTPVKDGTVIVTDSPKAKDAQAQTLEGLLVNHPLDCPVCDKAGECKLQDYSFQFGNAKSRMIDDKNQPSNKPGLSDKITLFTDRCIMCTRCVRFTREISGTAELQVINRGHHSEIDVFPGEPLDNKLSGNVVDLCPVGALGSKDFLKQRVWYLKSEKSVCPDCSTGCSIEVDTNKDVVFRLRPRENPQAQGHFMCDEGRWGYHYINDKNRLIRPEQREGGSLKATPWARILPAIRSDFADAAQRGTVWGIFSPFLTVEEAYLLARYLKGLSGSVKLALGPVPVVGNDDSYPKDRRGNGPTTSDDVKFTIRAEKCPNRRGVEAVLRHFQGEIIPLSQLADASAVFLTAGYTRPGWLSEAAAPNLAKAPLILTMDFFPGPATVFAKYVLPATAFAEKEGTFVNHAGLAQMLRRAARPPQECRSEGQVFADLLERRGLWRAADTRRELAAEVPALAALSGELGEHGIKM